MHMSNPVRNIFADLLAYALCSIPCWRLCHNYSLLNYFFKD